MPVKGNGQEARDVTYHSCMHQINLSSALQFNAWLS
jgi:hypothetical protein